jgi:hypothetical protein
MTPLKNMPRKWMVVIGLGIWLGPSCLLIPQLVKNCATPKQIVSLLPIIHGYTLEWWVAHTYDRFSWSRAVTISIVLPVVLVLILLCTPQRKVAIICGTVASFALTVLGYCLLVA